LSIVKGPVTVCRVSPLTAIDAGDTTRQRILDVALELFSSHGFAATSTRELSERLGFTKAALYYHFHTKDELLQALVDPVMTELNGVLDRHGASGRPADAAGRRAVLVDYLAVISAHRRLIGVLVQDPSAAGRPAMEAGRQFYVRLADLLAAPDRPVQAEQTRVRFVLGGLHAAVLFADPGDDPGTVRATALAAGYAALGLPEPS
jgi:AcrR family transcriptional regulator